MLQEVARFLVWQPGNIWAIALLFAVLFLAALVAKTRTPQISAVPLLVAALFWLAYGFWEHQAQVQRWDIRVDLILLWPFLFLSTAVLCALSVARVVWTALRKRR